MRFDYRMPEVVDDEHLSVEHLFMVTLVRAPALASISAQSLPFQAHEDGLEQDAEIE